MAKPRGNGDDGTTVSPPVELSAQPDVVAAKTGTTEAVVPPDDMGVIGEGEGGRKEGEEAAVGGDFGCGNGLEGGGGNGCGSGNGMGGVGGVSGSGGGMVKETPVEETPVISRRSGEPKGKGINMEEPVVTPGPVGLTALDYAVFARQEDVMERVQENPAVLDAFLEEVREVREAEMARVRVTTEEERDAEA